MIDNCKFLTYAELLRWAEREPIVAAIIEDRVAAIQPYAFQGLSAQLDEEGRDDAVDAASYDGIEFWKRWNVGYTHAKVLAASYCIPPGFTPWLMHDPKTTVAPVPRNSDIAEFTKEELKQLYMSEKKRHREILTMIDEEDDDITDPGIGPATPEPDGSVHAAPQEYPSVLAADIAKTDRCYTCASQRYLVRFYRSKLDHMIVCGLCLYDHLGWDYSPQTGELRKVLDM